MARRKSSIPTLQVFNNALKLAYQNVTFQEALTDRRLWGRIFESAVGAFIINQAFKYHIEVFYWRERDLEVDYILKKNNSIIAIEVKSNSEINTRGLDEFRKRFNPKAAFIVGEGRMKPEEFMSLNLSPLF